MPNIYKKKTVLQENMKDDKNAIGGNYKLEHLKVFSSVENFYKNVKSYRRIFDESDSRYIYGEISFFNKLFDEQDWKCTARLVCTDITTGAQICDMKKDIEVKKDQNVFKVQEGWGTPNPGWWKQGKYKWDAYLGEQYLATAYFYVTNEGLVSSTNNPYFTIQSIKMFESPNEGTPIGQRKYLKTFNKTSARYINAEIDLNITSNSKCLPLDFKFNFFNDIGQHKAYVEYFKEIADGSKTHVFDTGYGAAAGNYWYEDDYTMEVTFMDALIAVVPFKVGLEDEESDGVLSFAVDNRNDRTTAVGTSNPTGKPTFDEASAELKTLIGLDTVKKQIDEFSTYLKFLKIREQKGFKENNTFNLHTAFLGNPGTGKTTVAKMLGKIYHSLDLLSKGHVYEVGRVDLVGEYIGQTAPKVQKAIEKARGGILFIDEAYALSDRGDDGKDFGKEVIEVLLKEMSDGKGDLAVVFAGYPKEMQSFLTSNPGMSSRISSHIIFTDYVPDELMQIAEFAAQKRDVKVAEDARILLHKKVVESYRTRDEHFGNARFVNGIIEECKQNMALRLMKVENFESLGNDELSTITLEDVEKAFGITNTQKVHIPVDNAALAEALKELHEMVGMDEVKRDVDEMAKLVHYYTDIGRDVRQAFSMHTVFTGNPGTGKTTVARIIVKIYKALGILERGHLVECDRKGLVAGYIGQTAIKTAQMIDEALGGGLFIDEAYALTQGGENDFGKEAVDTLLKRMEDQRGEFIIIAAGYPEEMRKFLEMNPGLMSRFDRTIHFPDYSAVELVEIADTMFDKENLYLDSESKAYLQKYIEQMLEHKHKYFGNARTMRKVVKEIARRQNLRLAALPTEKRTGEMVKLVTMEDFHDFKLLEQENDKTGRKEIGFR